jgi:hypothetical protein
VLCGLQSARKESRSVGASVLEDQVHQISRFLKSPFAAPQSFLAPGRSIGRCPCSSHSPRRARAPCNTSPPAGADLRPGLQPRSRLGTTSE